MISSNEVCKTLYSFTQLAFKSKIEDLKSKQLKRDCEEDVFNLLKSIKKLTLNHIEELSANELKLLYELLTQYIMFLTMFSELEFPESFLFDSSENQLGNSILKYILEHSWPFPQLLPN